MLQSITNMTMSMGESLAEKGYLPDMLLRQGIRYRCAQVIQEQKVIYPPNNVEVQAQRKMEYIKKLKANPIAIKTVDANKQHYEVSLVNVFYPFIVCVFQSINR